MAIYDLVIHFVNPEIAPQFYSRVSDSVSSDRYFREVPVGVNIWLPGGKRIFFPWTAISKFELTRVEG